MSFRPSLGKLTWVHRCTTELGAFAKLEPEFTRRGVKLIGLSANTVESHGGWVKDIDEISGSHLKFPIIGDKVNMLGREQKRKRKLADNSRHTLGEKSSLCV